VSPGLALYLTAWLGLAVINALKGKWWMAVLFSGGLIGLITAIRVAKPDSYWDRTWSSVAAHEKAVSRFTKHRHAVATALPPLP
jgi:hypothetical protein